METKVEIENLQQQVLQKQAFGVAEVIAEEDVVAALNILNYMVYKNEADVFLGCAAVNLLNVYVKQKGAKINYEFKRHLLTILQGIEEVQAKGPSGIEVIYDNRDKQRILLIQIDGFQFSYKFERMTKIIAKLMSAKETPWDGIRKQMCGKTIFYAALNLSDMTNQSLNGWDLRAFIRNEMDCYEKGFYTFVNGRLTKQTSQQRMKAEEDTYLKNYMRTRLCAYQERPVILIGTCKRIWDKHVTFTTIRPYIKGIQTITICDHINISLPELERSINVTTLQKNKKYYIIGYCEKYKNSERMGVRLAENLEHAPILAVGDIRKISRDVFADCSRFSAEEYVSEKQRSVTL